MPAKPFSFLRTLFVLPLALLGCGGPSTCGALKRFLYEHPGRDGWQKPEQVVAALALAPGAQVADLGSGGGYFTFPLAEAVGATGRVYAVDVDDDLLAYLAEQAEERGLAQIVTVRAGQSDPGLAVESADLIFLSNVFHHLPEPAVYFANARKLLRPGGRVAIVEASHGGLFHSGHATPPEEIAAAMDRAGYELAVRETFLERQSFQIFTPREP